MSPVDKSTPLPGSGTQAGAAAPLPNPEPSDSWQAVYGVLRDVPPEHLALWHDCMREYREQKDREEAEQDAEARWK